MKGIRELFKIIDHRRWVPHTADEDTSDFTLSVSQKIEAAYSASLKENTFKLPDDN